MASAVPEIPHRPGAGSPTGVLADYLASRREHFLQVWQAAVSADRELTSSDNLSRTEFRDHIPQVLTDFVHALRQENSQSPANHSPPDSDSSAEHGKHRWKQGYDLREVILEWGHLQSCLLDELETARAALADLPSEAFRKAMRTLSHLMNNAIADSSEQFALLQQKQAAAERGDLENTVARFIENGERRALLWRESSHDLRGQLSIVISATSLLEEPDLDAAIRAESLQMLQKGTGSLKAMLTGVLEDTQTEAHREERQTRTIDAAALLGGLCAASQPFARERNLTLRSRGPENLSVEGDQGKIQRIAQNLLLNALAYTGQGGVTVSWQEDDPLWWSFQVRDTGPGLPGQGDERQPGPGGQRQGEGIGLAIVRRLSEVLGARLHVETAPGAGTAFTVALPRRYAA